MQLAKFRNRSGQVSVARVLEGQLYPLALPGSDYGSLADILESDDPGSVAESLLDTTARPIGVSQAALLAPVDQQEIWAAGVTYRRSKTARMEESDVAALCYDRVYQSPRPELFLKATPHRVSGPNEPLRIRSDSQWNVPEPELTLVLNSRLELVGFTAGNDMSSRDIEGENPLYLPQAKVYDACCGIGPTVTLSGWMPPADQIGIRLVVHRGARIVFDGSTSTAQLARTFTELTGWLGRDNSFPAGVMLMTGTGIVPESNFTLQHGDIVEITIDGIGTLSNPIVQG